MMDPVLEALNRSAEEHTPEDIDAIIAFLRKSYHAYVAGEKPKKEGDGVDVAAVLKIEPKLLGLRRI